MTTESSKTCGIGLINAIMNKAIAHWKHSRTSDEIPDDATFAVEELATMATSGASYISIVPPPPYPGTPQYTACILYWQQAYQAAQMCQQRQSQIDYLQQTKANIENQLSQLQASQAASQLALTNSLTDYTNCMSGTSV